MAPIGPRGVVGEVRLPVRINIFAVISVLFACRLAVSLVLIPPWQHPDEHAHVAIAEVFESRLRSSQSSDPWREEEILRSMADHEWWRHYGAPSPDPLPARFTRLPARNASATLGIDATSPDHPRPYYAAIGAVLAFAPRMSVVDDLYVMRALSAALAMLTLWVAWRAARELLGETAGTTVAVMLALHPQFAVVSTAASSDALANLAGVLVWWQAMRAVRGSNVTWPLTVMWVAAICGAVADRMAVPLLIAACAISVAAFLRTGVRRSTIVRTIAILALLAASLRVLAAWRTFRGVVWEQVLPLPQAQTWEYFVRFTFILVESWWASLGWQRYPPPWWLATFALGLTAVAVVGVIRRFLWDDHVRTRTILGVSVTIVAIQVAAVYWIYFRLAHGAQGRHLFPALIPALVLIWIGIETWVPAQYRQHAAVGLVLTFAALDSLVWTLVAVPAYAP